MLEKLFDLSGRTALVTGGSRGIGEMIARGLVESGVKTYISSRKGDACASLADELSASGECIALPADLSQMSEIDRLAAALGEREQQLDILVNNAGAAWGEPYDEFSEGGWDKVMNLNLKSVFFLTQKCTPLLRAAATAERPAKVINIASIDGIRVPDLETYSYSASKSGLIHLTRRLAKRLIEDRIIVTGIAPGAFASSMNKMARDQADEVSQWVPAKRIGTPEDMAGTVIFLASRAGDYVVGSTIAVDGGVAYAM
ncbi:SDR family oxidoreductase [Exilibacterium tricleocarpae]|uniref:SDR family oxidoreductase n=1 Tax=Exilibacterium tricleocarpae TaxID=2591008 RepID=A0A545U5D5_9GAMM|nr:SDR family oxidoreductase [Exilibacterium tricleocarpae]TQV84674.1 SDR family oxidoreductase [Exilibacterium tricleocarpae]